MITGTRWKFIPIRIISLNYGEKTCRRKWRKRVISRKKRNERPLRRIRRALILCHLFKVMFILKLVCYFRLVWSQNNISSLLISVKMHALNGCHFNRGISWNCFWRTKIDNEKWVFSSWSTQNFNGSKFTWALWSGMTGIFYRHKFRNSMNFCPLKICIDAKNHFSLSILLLAKKKIHEIPPFKRKLPKVFRSTLISLVGFESSIG